MAELGRRSKPNRPRLDSYVRLVAEVELHAEAVDACLRVVRKSKSLREIMRAIGFLERLIG